MPHFGKAKARESESQLFSLVSPCMRVGKVPFGKLGVPVCLPSSQDYYHRTTTGLPQVCYYGKRKKMQKCAFPWNSCIPWIGAARVGLSNDFSALFPLFASRGIQVETALVPCATIASTRHIASPALTVLVDSLRSSQRWPFVVPSPYSSVVQ